MQITVNVNGADYSRDVEARLLLIHFLRDDLGLTGSHWGCDTSNCGACVVWLDDIPVKSCTVLAAMADGRRVRTVEDLAMKRESEQGSGEGRGGGWGVGGGADGATLRRLACRSVHGHSGSPMV